MVKKSIAKRIQVTKTGKLIRRHMGISHFKAKKSSKQRYGRQKPLLINPVDIKMFKKYISLR